MRRLVLVRCPSCGVRHRLRELEAGRQRGAAEPHRNAHPAAQTTQFYQRLGRLAAGEPLPFVGTVAFAAGPGDSVIAVLGLSLENRALRISKGRERRSSRATGWASPSSGTVRRPVDLAREEVVRVATFQETQRADESVLFQQVLRLVPGNLQGHRDRAGRLHRRPRAAPPGSTRAPKFGTATYSAPILTYQATGRGSRDRSARPGAQPSRRRGIRERHAARVRRGVWLPGARDRAVQGAGRGEQHDLRRLAAVSGGPGGGEPGHSARP